MSKLLESVKILRLKPGDIIVIETERRLTQEIVDRIEKQAKAAFPGHKAVIMSDTRLRVTREETEDLPHQPETFGGVS